MSQIKKHSTTFLYKRPFLTNQERSSLLSRLSPKTRQKLGHVVKLEWEKVKEKRTMGTPLFTQINYFTKILIINISGLVSRYMTHTNRQQFSK